LIIKPSSDLRKNYNSVAQVAIETGEPIFLTLNGEGHTVLQSVTAFNKRDENLKIAEQLIAAERGRAAAAIFNGPENCVRYGHSIPDFERAVKSGIEGEGLPEYDQLSLDD